MPLLWDLWSAWEKILTDGAGNGRNGAGLALSHALIAVVVASVTAALWVQGSIYTTKVGIEQEIRQSVQESDTRLRADLNEKLSHYLTIERFLVRENEQKDNYNALLASIDRLAARSARR